MPAFSYQKQDVDYSFLIFTHLLQMGETSKRIISSTTPSVEALAGFRAQVAWFETLITPFLNDQYYDKVEKFGVSPNQTPERTNDIKSNMRYFDKVNRWMQLLIIYAYNYKLLRVRKRFISPNEIEGFIETGRLKGDGKTQPAASNTAKP